MAGLLRPGDTVDVIVTIRPDTNALGADWVTETILQAVRVLAVGSTVIGTEEGDDEPTDTTRKRTEVVTLEVSPEEAEKLALATARGELHLALRGGEDQELLLNRGPLVTNALVGLAPRATKPTRRAPPKVTPVEPRRESAEVIEGTKTKVQEFDDEGRKVENGGRSR